jgi:hypothetical protein
MQPINYCRKYFSAIFCSLLTAHVLVFGLFFSIGLQQEYLEAFLKQRSFSALLTLLLSLGIFYVAGLKIYDRHIGPRLRAWKWDEESYLTGLGFSAVVFLVMDTLSIAAIITVARIFKS